jgi:hypothetical protein
MYVRLFLEYLAREDKFRRCHWEDRRNSQIFVVTSAFPTVTKLAHISKPIRFNPPEYIIYCMTNLSLVPLRVLVYLFYCPYILAISAGLAVSEPPPFIWHNLADFQPRGKHEQRCFGADSWKCAYFPPTSTKWIALLLYSYIYFLDKDNLGLLARCTLHE